MKNKHFLLLIVLISPFYAKAQEKNPQSFELTSATDASHFRLTEAKGSYVALHFLLKTECPYCLQHTRDYFIKSKELPNVIQVFIKPDSKNDILNWANNLEDNDSIDYPIYRDPEAELANSYNIPDGYFFHDQFVHYPAFILLDKSGKEIFRYVGESNSDRFKFNQLIHKMKEITELESKSK
jgi:peroxiredoxin Q/BCP